MAATSSSICPVNANLIIRTVHIYVVQICSL
jgi:hypothetical protein